MKRNPVTLIIDDGAPHVHLYYHHIPDHRTLDGRSLRKDVPNELLYRFCDLVEEYGIGGKFSVVPMPGGLGDIRYGIEGMPEAEFTAWKDTVRTRIMPHFDICPEILTHAQTVDLQNGGFLPLTEKEWGAKQDRSTLTPYIEKAIRMLDEAGMTPTGVTSPWDFGKPVEEEYRHAISQAFCNALGVKDAWYFLHCVQGRTDVFPEKVLEEEGRRLVSVTSTCSDHFWQGIDTPDASDDFIRSIADHYLSEDGKSGEILPQIENHMPVVLLTHWQSMYSNGSFAGLSALRLVCERIRRRLSDRVEWVNFSCLMRGAL